jgi:hypothetical protein
MEARNTMTKTRQAIRAELAKGERGVTLAEFVDAGCGSEAACIGALTRWHADGLVVCSYDAAVGAIRYAVAS